MKNKAIMFLYLYVLLLLFTACGAPTRTFGVAFRLTGAQAFSHQATVALVHAPVGTADLSWSQETNKLLVSLQLSGLAPGSRHPVHIHAGTCQHSGIILSELPSVVADARGQAALRTVLSVGRLPTGAWLLNAHNGPTLMTPGEQVAIACAQVPVEPQQQSSFHAKVPFGATTAPNEAVSGIARLSFQNGTLSVTVMVHGLVSNSAHAAHIHAGRGFAQGKVLFALDPLVADAWGNASETHIFHNVRSIPAAGWYLNVHFGAAVPTPTLFNPIAYGNIIMR
jgi:hypothetical protein